MTKLAPILFAAGLALSAGIRVTQRVDALAATSLSSSTASSVKAGSPNKICEQCTYANPPTATLCEICATEFSGQDQQMQEAPEADAKLVATVARYLDDPSNSLAAAWVRNKDIVALIGNSKNQQWVVDLGMQPSQNKDVFWQKVKELIMPEGFKVGDTVLYNSVDWQDKLTPGDKLTYGDAGTVVGPSKFIGNLLVKFSKHTGDYKSLPPNMVNTLESFGVEKDGMDYWCDACGEQIPVGKTMYGCLLKDDCSYDLCNKCYNKRGTVESVAKHVTDSSNLYWVLDHEIGASDVADLMITKGYLKDFVISPSQSTAEFWQAVRNYVEMDQKNIVEEVKQGHEQMKQGEEPGLRRHCQFENGSPQDSVMFEAIDEFEPVLVIKRNDAYDCFMKRTFDSIAEIPSNQGLFQMPATRQVFPKELMEELGEVFPGKDILVDATSLTIIDKCDNRYMEVAGELANVGAPRAREPPRAAEPMPIYQNHGPFADLGMIQGPVAGVGKKAGGPTAGVTGGPKAGKAGIDQLDGDMARRAAYIAKCRSNSEVPADERILQMEERLATLHLLRSTSSGSGQKPAE